MKQSKAKVSPGVRQRFENWTGVRTLSETFKDVRSIGFPPVSSFDFLERKGGIMGKLRTPEEPIIDDHNDASGRMVWKRMIEQEYGATQGG